MANIPAHVKLQVDLAKGDGTQPAVNAYQAAAFEANQPSKIEHVPTTTKAWEIDKTLPGIPERISPNFPKVEAAPAAPKGWEVEKSPAKENAEPDVER